MPNYQKLYAYMAGEVDEALEMIANGYVREGYGKDRLVIAVGEKLKGALLKAEEMYVEAEEERSNGGPSSR